MNYFELRKGFIEILVSRWIAQRLKVNVIRSTWERGLHSFWNQFFDQRSEMGTLSSPRSPTARGFGRRPCRFPFRRADFLAPCFGGCGKTEARPTTTKKVKRSEGRDAAAKISWHSAGIRVSFTYYFFKFHFQRIQITSDFNDDRLENGGGRQENVSLVYLAPHRWPPFCKSNDLFVCFFFLQQK